MVRRYLGLPIRFLRRVLDRILSFVSGLLTTGSKFRGALDEAAAMVHTGLTPREFVDKSRKADKLIGQYPDLRVKLVKEYVLKSFTSHRLLNYALAVC
ncbi:unnamed protein product [Rhizoctonia solani]|uniref:Uncharacterized protein n=1 Tax=Rhizoctonia solani TaxID=456999 RepID=A0A8H3DWS9_9AGAM|nr:unnamed protein product [Rhizoctonia solani]